MNILENIRAYRFPLPGEIKNAKFTHDVIINVSDEWIPSSYTTALDKGIKYFWFPMTECYSDMGLNSIFAALQIIYHFKTTQPDVSIMVHCHAGACRSRLILECYHYMMTGQHYYDELSKSKKVKINFASDEVNSQDEYVQQNVLQQCCSNNHLPKIELMEEFLDGMLEIFLKDESYRGGYLDTFKIKLKN